MISRSAIEVLDKQDPSLVTELLLLYEQFYDAGYLFCAYYYKGLNPLERIKFASASKAIMVLRRESLQKLKCLGRHFMTNQTFKDMMTAIDGLILYIIDCVKYEAEIVPWFLSSDSLKQLFSWLRVGRYEGRRTNLDYLTVVQGAGKSNQNYAMDGEGLHLLEPTIPHTRGGRLLSQPPDDEIIIYTGKDICLAEVRIALGTGSELGQDKFANHTSFAPVNTPVSVTRGRGNNEDETEDVSDDGVDTDKLEFDFEDGMFEFGSRYHINTAVSKFLNDGRTPYIDASNV